MLVYCTTLLQVGLSGCWETIQLVVVVVVLSPAHRYQRGSLTLLASSLISPLPLPCPKLSPRVCSCPGGPDANPLMLTTAPLTGPIASLSKSIHVLKLMTNYVGVGVYLYADDQSSLLPHGRCANLDQKKTITYTNRRQQHKT